MYSQAWLQVVAGNCREALSLVRELEALVPGPAATYGRIAGHVVAGHVMERLGQRDSTTIHYDEALRLAGGTDEVNIRIYLALNYGRFLLARGDAASARDWFSTGLELSLRSNNLRHREELLLALAACCVRTGATQEALRYYEQYHGFIDSLARLQREHSFNHLVMRNERLEHERDVRIRELELVKARHRNQIIAGLLAFAVLAAGSVYLLYLYRNRMYWKLVECYRQLDEAWSRIRRAASGEGCVGAEEMKMKRLYESIEELMREEHLYRQNDLSLETIAGMLGKNKVDISRAINRFAETTFYNYINAYRIHEAVALLSDSENDMPIKALYRYLGFNSVSVFYNSFTKETGIPPSRFRKASRR